MIDSNRYIEWYYYSLISSSGPSHLELKYKNQHKKILFYQSESLCQVSVENDTIKILAENGDVTLLRKKVENFIVVLDTTCKGAYLYKNE